MAVDESDAEEDLMLMTREVGRQLDDECDDDDNITHDNDNSYLELMMPV